MRVFTSLLAVTLFAGCAASTSEVAGTTKSAAVVSQEDANEAFRVAAAIDYLPFGYTQDGCYARALFMSMEIATHGIATSAEYIHATAGGVLSPGNGVFWGWHVAPMVQVGKEGTPQIIDPSLFTAPRVARDLSDWITASNPVSNDASVDAVGPFYAVERVVGSHYRNREVSPGQDLLVSSFAELPAFKFADLEDACDVAWDYLGRETPALAEADLAAKRARLTTRTGELVPALVARGKLDGYTAGDPVHCPRVVAVATEDAL